MAAPNSPTVGIYHYLGFSQLRGGALKTVRLFAEAGYDVTLTILPPRDDAPSHIEQQVPAGVTIRRVRLWSRGLPRFHGALLKLVEMMARHAWHAWRSKFDLYVAIDAPAALPVFIGTRLNRKRMVYLALELFAETHWAPARPLWRLVDRFLCPRIGTIVAVDEMRAKHMVEYYKARGPFTIRNTPPYRQVARTDRIPRLLAESGVRDAKIAICQGNIEPGRNIEVMIDSVQYLSENIVLMFLGWSEKEYLAEVKDLVKERRLEKRVFFHPPVLPDEVWDFAASAHLGLLVYRNLSLNFYYSCGASLRLYEYFMAGLPVVAPNFPGFPEVIEGQGLGKCADPDDPKAIAASINSLLEDEAAWQAMRARALVAAKEKYNWEIDGARLLEICGELIKQG